MYIHVHVCIHVHVFVCIHSYVCVCSCMCTHTCSCVCAHACALMCGCVHSRVCLHSCAYAHICMRVHLTLECVYLCFTEAMRFIESVSLTLFLSPHPLLPQLYSARPLSPCEFLSWCQPRAEDEGCQGGNARASCVPPERGHRGQRSQHQLQFTSVSSRSQVRCGCPPPATSVDTAHSSCVGAGK